MYGMRLPAGAPAPPHSKARFYELLEALKLEFESTVSMIASSAGSANAAASETRLSSEDYDLKGTIAASLRAFFIFISPPQPSSI